MDEAKKRVVPAGPPRRIKWGEIVLILLLASALIASLVWAYLEIEDRDKTIDSKNNKISSLEDELSGLEEEYEDYQKSATSMIKSKDAIITQRDSRISELEEDVSLMLEQIAEWEEKYGETYSELQHTSEELSRTQDRLNRVSEMASEAYNRLVEMLEWVDDNDELPSDAEDDIYSECGDPTWRVNETCYVDTYALGQYMASCFTYSSDSSRGRDPQTVTSCDDFWDGGTGDCDDFALFGAAWLRTEIERSEDSCDNVVVLLSDKPYSYCETHSCDTASIEADESDVYVVCGVLDGGTGHCEVGVATSSKIFESESKLKKIEVFEPQSGEYDGQLDDIFEELLVLISEEDIIFYEEWDILYTLSEIEEEYEDILEDL